MHPLTTNNNTWLRVNSLIHSHALTLVPTISWQYYETINANLRIIIQNCKVITLQTERRYRFWCYCKQSCYLYSSFTWVLERKHILLVKENNNAVHNVLKTWVWASVTWEYLWLLLSTVHFNNHVCFLWRYKDIQNSHKNIRQIDWEMSKQTSGRIWCLFMTNHYPVS